MHPSAYRSDEFTATVIYSYLQLSTLIYTKNSASALCFAMCHPLFAICGVEINLVRSPSQAAQDAATIQESTNPRISRLCSLPFAPIRPKINRSPPDEHNWWQARAARIGVELTKSE